MGVIARLQKPMEEPMAEILACRGKPRPTVFQLILRILGRANISSASGDADLRGLQRDKNTIRELSRLSDEQLSDIGMYRKRRSVRSDYLGRDLQIRQQVSFDYYRLDI